MAHPQITCGQSLQNSSNANMAPVQQTSFLASLPANLAAKVEGHNSTSAHSSVALGPTPVSYAGLGRLWAQGIIHLDGTDGQRCDRGAWGQSITSDSARPRQNPTFSDHRTQEKACNYGSGNIWVYSNPQERLLFLSEQHTNSIYGKNLGLNCLLVLI